MTFHFIIVSLKKKELNKKNHKNLRNLKSYDFAFNDFFDDKDKVC